MAELSPMMKQYKHIKAQNEDSILLFRLGDFYEMFFEDAKLASEELDLVLTGRDCGLDERAPMCGMPYHSCDSYIARLVEKGYKVAICEQMEDPSVAKGIVKREVIRVITPGTVIEDSMLDESKNNYLASVCFKEGSCGVCFVDASTGALHLTQISGDNVEQRLMNEFGRFSPREVLNDDSFEMMTNFKRFLAEKLNCRISTIPHDHFVKGFEGENTIKHFGVLSVEELNLTVGGADTAAVDVAVKYLHDAGMSGLSSINKIDYYTDSQFMKLDITAVRNLELTETMRGKSKKGSLLWVLDKTKTAMGKRLIRGWVEQPLLNVSEITLRLNAVDELVSDTVLRGETYEYLSGIHDIERLMTRIVYGTAGARELVSLSFTISRFGPIKSLLSSANSRMLKSINEDIDTLEDVSTLIDSAIVENPPFSVREGGIIKDGYNSEVDLLRTDMTGGKDFIANIETTEKERTGIKSLKVRYNKVFGYYIEISNSYLNIVPPEYIRKQTLSNCERYITDELKRLEARVLGAKDRVVQLEYELFEGIRKKVAENLERIQKTAAALARLDVLSSLAMVAVNNNYCRPSLNNEGKILITDGRHPVVEEVLSAPFVANDTTLDMGENRCAIITGPNMAGKSTYMRQVALITVMAQIGSFVPARSANIGVVDAVYTRVGASDDLASGQSTFMVEMSEVADILKNATNRSLLILDEIGRGTSTFDGMSIARAVLEYVADKRKLGAKTLFATHYHELTTLEGQLKGVKNYNIAVRKHGDDITFLRRIVRGGADDSYGIEVAKLSGIPNGVIERAKQILKIVESEGVIQTVKENDNDAFQLPFGLGAAGSVIDELKALDVNTLTPIEAMRILFDISSKAKNI